MNKTVDYFIWQRNCMACVPGNSNWHRHAAIQLYCSPEKAISVEIAGQQQLSGKLLIIPSHCVRRLHSESPVIQFAYNPLAVEHRQVHRINELINCDISIETQRQVDQFLQKRSTQQADIIKDQLQTTLNNLVYTLHMDERVGNTCELLAAHFNRTISNAEIAAAVRLSESRLQHLFKQQTGIALTQYRQWLRLRMSFQLIAQGKKPIDAACEAGFADQAHYSRLFKRTFGYTPSGLLRQHGKASINIMETMRH